MDNFYPLERWALQRIAAEYPDLTKDLLQQFNAATIVSRENTGYGFFTCFTIDRKATGPLKCESPIGNLWARVAGTEDILTFLVFLEDGFACMLEGVGIDVDESDVDFSQAKLSPLEPDH